MASLSSAQIRTFAQNAGFSGDTLDIMVAIAFAESGGNPNNHNTTPPDDSYGLWQINMFTGTDPRTGKHVDLGSGRRVLFNIKTNDQLFDPATNAKAAHTIYKGSGLKAWTTYTSDKYKEFLTGAPADATGTTEKSDSGVFSGISSSINAVGTNLFNGIANLSGMIVAVSLIIVGIILLAVTSGFGKKIAKKAVKATPVGGVIS